MNLSTLAAIGLYTACSCAVLGASQIVLTSSGPQGSQTDYINQFELYDNGIYWTEGSGDCSVEFRSYSEIGMVGALGGAIHKVTSDCTLHFSDVVRNDAYVYFGTGGRLYRKAVNSLPTDPNLEIVTPFTPIASGFELGAMTIWNDRVYWSDSNGTYFDILNVKPDGTDPQYFLLGTGNKPIKMRGFSYSTGLFQFTDAILILTEGGDLIRWDVNPKANSTVTLAHGVTDFVIRGESAGGGSLLSSFTSIYATTGQRTGLKNTTPHGTVLRINPASAATSTIFNAPDQDQLTAIAADSGNLYVTEQPVVCGGLFGCLLGDPTLKRQSNPANGPTPAKTFDLIGTGSDAGFNLRSDGVWLYFESGANVRRLPTDAPALQLDFQADGVEVVQAVQNLNSDVTLIANRPTFVRGYAHVNVNTTGQNGWIVDAQLRGFLNGVELPGSPILNVNNPTLLDKSATLATLRSSPANSYLFPLPPEWVTGSGLPIDILTFSMTINPDHGVPETGATPLANNTISLLAPAKMVRKGQPCIISVPLICVGPGTYYGGGTSFDAIMSRCRSLLPVQDLNVFPSVVTIAQGDNDDPFDLGSSDSGTASSAQDDALDTLDDLDLDSDPCSDQDEHFLGMVDPADGQPQGFNGVSWRNSPELVVRMRSDSAFGVSISGGLFMSHEMGHNYGLQHINCGNFPPGQANFDPSPFPCSLGNPDVTLNSATFGFDSLTLQVIPPNTASDIMSYGNPVWITKQTWDTLLGATAPADALPIPGQIGLSGLGGNRVMLVRGRIHQAQQIGVFRNFYLLPLSAAPSAKVARSRAAADRAAGQPDPYFARLLNGQGQVLKQIALVTEESHVDDQPAPDTLNFAQYVDFVEGTVGVQLVHTNHVLAERFISPNAPALTLGVPVVDTAAQTVFLNWQASDADGDPLHFIISYSADNGATWRAFKHDYPGLEITLDARLLAGGQQCRLRVAASDGVNSTVAVSSAFVIPKHAPVPYIGGVVEGQRLPFGQRAELSGYALDAETGSADLSLAWNLTGPTARTGVGHNFSLFELAPGPYQATLTAIDPDQQAGSLTRGFSVNPFLVPDAAAPQLDGICSDPGYAQATLIRFPLDNGGRASVRLLHANGNLYACFTGLQYGIGAAATTPRTIGLRIHPGPNPGSTAQAGDIGFFVDDSGIPSQEIALRGSMQPTLTPQPGFKAVVHRGDSSWSAEFAISESLVGGWNHAVSLMVAHDAPQWPAPATRNNPASWAAGFFGTNAPAAPNQAPVASAGSDQRLYLSQPRTLYLDGSASFDPDGQTLQYAWKQVSGPTVSLSDTNVDRPSFPAAPVTSATDFVFELIVADGQAQSTPSQVKVSLLPAVQRPVVVPATGFAQVESGGLLHFRLMGDSQRTYRIESSTDLSHWNTERTVVADFSGRIEFSEVADLQQGPVRFFRAAAP